MRMANRLNTNLEMRFILSISILLFSISDIKAQMAEFPEGIYMNYEQLKTKKPSYNVKLKVIKRSLDEIKLKGGNDYELETTIDSLSGKFLKKKVYAYVVNDSLFINGFKHEYGFGYCLATCQGTFIVFQSGLNQDEALSSPAALGILAGPIGGAISGAYLAKIRRPRVLSLRTGNARLLYKDYVSERLLDHKEIYDRYMAEQNPDDVEIMTMYLKELNEIVHP